MKWQSIIAFTLFLILSAYVSFYGLNNLPAINGDEARYLAITQNIINTGDYLSLKLPDGSNYFRKPPLQFWLMAISAQIFGDKIYSFRIPSALFSFLLFLLTAVITYKITSGAIYSLIPALLLIGNYSFVFDRCARAGTMDAGIIFLFNVATYFLLFSKRNIWLKFGIISGMATMLKGGWGLIIPLILFLDPSKNIIGRLIEVIKSYLLSAIIFLPWHIYMFYRFGREFLNIYLFFEQVSRIYNTVSLEYGWYLYISFLALWQPAGILFIYSLFRIKHIFSKPEMKIIMLISIAGVLLLSLLPSKAPRYLFPFMPLIAINVVVCLKDALQDKSSIINKQKNISIIVGISILIILSFQIVTTVWLINRKETNLLKSLADDVIERNDFCVEILDEKYRAKLPETNGTLFDLLRIDNGKRFCNKDFEKNKLVILDYSQINKIRNKYNSDKDFIYLVEGEHGVFSSIIVLIKDWDKKIPSSNIILSTNICPSYSTYKLVPVNAYLDNNIEHFIPVEKSISLQINLIQNNNDNYLSHILWRSEIKNTTKYLKIPYDLNTLIYNLCPGDTLELYLRGYFILPTTSKISAYIKFIYKNGDSIEIKMPDARYVEPQYIISIFSFFPRLFGLHRLIKPIGVQ